MNKLGYFLCIYLLCFQFCLANKDKYNEPLMSPEKKKWIHKKLNSLNLSEKIGQLFVAEIPNFKNQKQKDSFFTLLKKHNVGGICFNKTSTLTIRKTLSDHHFKFKVPPIVGYKPQWDSLLSFDDLSNIYAEDQLLALNNAKIFNVLCEGFAKQCKQLEIQFLVLPPIFVDTFENLNLIDKEKLALWKENLLLGIQNQNLATLQIQKSSENNRIFFKSEPIYNHNDDLVFKTNVFEGLLTYLNDNIDGPILELTTKIINKTLSLKDLDDMVLHVLSMKYDCGLESQRKLDLSPEFTDKLNELTYEANHKIAEKTIKVFSLNTENLLPINKNFSNLFICFGDTFINNIHKNIEDSFNATIINFPEDSILNDSLFDNINKLSTHYQKAYIFLNHNQNNDIFLFNFNKVNTFLKNYNPDSIMIFCDGLELELIDSSLLLNITLKNNFNWFTQNAIFDILNGNHWRSAGDFYISGWNLSGTFYERYKNKLHKIKTVDYVPFFNPSYEVLLNKHTDKPTQDIQLTVTHKPNKDHKYSEVLDEYLDTLLKFSLAQQAFTQGQFIVFKDHKIVYNRYIDQKGLKENPSLAESPVFDLENLTNSTLTSFILMKLFYEKYLDYYDNLGKFLPETQGTELEKIPLANLLLHRSGLPQAPNYYEYFKDPITHDFLPQFVNKTPNPNYSIKLADSLYLLNTIPHKLYSEILNTKLNDNKFYVYSDIGYFLLGKVIEKITNQSLETYFTDNFITALKLENTEFNPRKYIPKNFIVPSIKNDLIPNQDVHGFSTNPLTSIMGGVTGNGGLFSNAFDLGCLYNLMFVEFGNKSFFPHDIVLDFTSVLPIPNNRRALGFDKAYIDPNKKIFYPSVMIPKTSFGHNSENGSFVWVDPDNDFIMIFLVNQNYVKKDNDILKKFKIRQNLIDGVYKYYEQ